MPKLIDVPPGIYIGIDPGASGGLAALAVDGIDVVPMPPTETDIWKWFEWWSGKKEDDNFFAVIEQVRGYIGEGHPGSAMFKFGCSYGGLRMALTAAQIPFEQVPPQTWQKALGIPKRDKSESRTEWKNRLKAKAQQLFPQTKMTLATADALLLAEYCRRKRTGTL